MERGVTQDELPFWRAKSLAEMTRQEWEALCDGCGKCCLLKLQDEETDEVDYTDVACHLLDTKACRCTDYAHRHARVPDCVRLSPERIDAIVAWMPSTCAYRLLAEGRSLPDWHPLVSGDPESVHRAGISVRGRVVRDCGLEDEDLLARIVDWPR
jgi:uncharacterized cysteine cluster protein YcgN (CxxCxxCC family)